MTRASKDLRVLACMFCKDPLFHAYLRAIAKDLAGPPIEQGLVDESFARAFVLTACQIKTRTELDLNSIAAYRFHQLVRGPFMAWKATQRPGVPA
ncbi:MAG: hypothetical protein K0R43_1680 [Pseudoduganella sp.]|jgi:hypothetical protein|nr:hypothetical protein [Pseudoduganella sp.]